MLDKFCDKCKGRVCEIGMCDCKMEALNKIVDDDISDFHLAVAKRALKDV